MVLNLLAPIIGAGVTGLFGKLGGDKSAKAARLNAIYQQQQSDRQFNAQLAENAAARQMAEYQFGKQLEEAATDRALQKEFAQQGVSWRVADARASGIHPLAALGAQLASPSPISVSGSVPQGTVPSGPDIAPYGDGGGQALANMGQDLSRAVVAMSTEWERAKGIEQASKALHLENQKLENQLLAVQIAKTSGAAVGPSRPSTRTTHMIDGQGNTPSRSGLVNTPLVEEQKHKPVAAAPGAPHAEPGQVTDTGYSRTPTGWAPVPSKDVKERIEDNLISELMWEARNRVTQTLFQKGLQPPPHVPLEKGKVWKYNPLRQEYQQWPEFEFFKYKGARPAKKDWFKF